MVLDPHNLCAHEDGYSLDASEAGLKPGEKCPTWIPVTGVGDGKHFVFEGYDADHTAHYRLHQSDLTLKIWNDLR
jgi:hypothetical protein